MAKQKDIEYKQVVDGDVVKIKYKEEVYRNACCDCGLVHNYNFNVKGNTISMKINVNNHDTAMIRAKEKFKKK